MRIFSGSVLAVLLGAAGVLAQPAPAGSPDALDEVNAARAARGLPPFRRDPALTQAAWAAATYRAAYRISGHLTGGGGDFALLPPGARADAAGCGALSPDWGWGSCCTYEDYHHAGAAWAWGPDGKRYMHLFVRREWGQPQQMQGSYRSSESYQSAAGYSAGSPPRRLLRRR